MGRIVSDVVCGDSLNASSIQIRKSVSFAINNTQFKKNPNTNDKTNRYRNIFLTIQKKKKYEKQNCF